MKKLLTLFFLLALVPLGAFAQTSGNGQSKPWVVLTDEYDTSPFNDTTKVEIYFDGSAYTGYVTSVQFKINYDGDAFTKVYEVENLIGANYTISFNDDTVNDQVLVSMVYTGASTTTSFPNSAIVRLRFQNVHNQLLYNNEANLSAFSFGTYAPVGSNAQGADISIGATSHGGSVNIPHRKYYGYVKDIATDKGIPNLEYQLLKGNTYITTVLGGNPTKTTTAGYYEMVYYEYYYGYFVDGTTEFSFLFKTEDIDSDPALSTTDAYKQLLYANGKTTYTSTQKLASDVNHSHTSTIADAYTNYAYHANRFTNWATLGQGGYRDVMIVKPEHEKYVLDTDSTTTTALGVGPLGFEPQSTNWTYVLKDYNGQSDMTEDFYAVILGDVNQTSLGGTVPAGKRSLNSNMSLNGDSIAVFVTDTEAAPGAVVEVPVFFNTKQQNIGSFGLRLEYDKDILAFLSADSPVLSNSWMLYFNPGDGFLDYGGMDGSGGNFPINTNDDLILIKLYFQVLAGNNQQSALEFGSKNTAGDINGDDIPVAAQGALFVANNNASGVNAERDETLPAGIRISGVYPNPFNPTTTIEIEAGTTRYATVKVYDIMGREVKTLYDSIVMAGNVYRMRLDADNLVSGTYFVRLVAGSTVSIQPIHLIK